MARPPSESTPVPSPLLTPIPTRSIVFPRPKSSKELSDLVHSQPFNPTCYCSECCPDYTRDHWAGPYGYWTPVDLLVNPYCNRYGNWTFLPLRLYQAPVYEPLYLAQCSINHFDLPKEHLNELQLHALDAILGWIELRKDDVLCRVTHDCTAGQLLSEHELCSLWSCIIGLFFAVGVPRKIFWDPELPTTVLGQTCSKMWKYVRIDMNPNVKQSEMRQPLMFCLLGTLLHEAVHAFVMHHSYDECGMPLQRGLGIEGHGRPWQMLAAKVEEVFLRLTGLPILLGRWDAIRNHWNDVHTLPCKHDLAAWKLDDEAVIREYAEELTKAYREDPYPEEFRTVEFYEDWTRRRSSEKAQTDFLVQAVAALNIGQKTLSVAEISLSSAREDTGRRKMCRG